MISFDKFKKKTMQKVEVKNPNYLKEEKAELKRQASYKKNRLKRKRLKKHKRKN